MKKICILSLLFLLMHFQCIIGQRTFIRLIDGAIVTGGLYSTMPTRTIEYVDDGILVTYRFDYVSLSTDHLFPSSSILEFEGFGIGEYPEKPALPVRWDRFYVPSENDYSINIIDSSFVEIPIEIGPARPGLENSSNAVYTTDNVPPIKPYEGFYPQSNVNSILNIYRTYPLLDISVSPVSYNYQLRKARICKCLAYLIRSNCNKSNPFDPEDYYTDPLLANIVMNPKTVSGNVKNNQRTTAVQIPTQKYLILTTPTYMEAVNKLADWKRTQGFNVEILSRTVWDTLSVRHSIRASHQYSPISYLLIFGDSADVPGTKRFPSNKYVTDYYYGCINQFSYPDIHRGRISASSQSEAAAIVDKIIYYERTPNTNVSFYQKGINCAFFQDNNIDGFEDQRYTLTSEEIRDHLIQQGKTVNRVYYANSIVTPGYWRVGNYGLSNTTPIPDELLRINGFQWDGNYQDIIDNINAGCFYVFFRDHGHETDWAAPYFDLTHIGELDNGNKLPVVFSICCSTGRYASGTCFAEAFLRKSVGGCVGIIAASQPSISGSNDALALGMFEAIWPTPSFIKPFPSGTQPTSFVNTPIYRLGDIMDQGFFVIPDIYPAVSDSALRLTKEMYHYFGDPAMEIYTDVPTAFENVSITKENGDLIVSVGEDATITFYNKSTGTIESFYGSNITYPDGDNLQVCITAHNKIPYIRESGCIFIQNEVISDTRTYHSDQIKIGSNVTSIKPSGPVHFTNGKTKITADEVELTEETIIEPGAVLEINN